MATDFDGAAKLSTLPNLSSLVPPEVLRQWIKMEPPPLQLAEDAAMCEEAKYWLAFAASFEENDKDWKDKLQSLNTHLLKKSVVCGNGITITPVDISVFLAVRPIIVTDVIPSFQKEFQNVVRWFDYIQSEDKVAAAFQTVSIRKSKLELQDFFKTSAKKPEKLDRKEGSAEIVPSGDAMSSIKKDQKDLKPMDGKEQELKNLDANKEEKKGKKEKNMANQKQEKKPEDELSVSVLDIRVGLIVKVWKHPSADALFVEEIDLGEGTKRQVVSGLARYLKEEDLLNKKVVLIANVKPGKLRDVLSSGLVLCASTTDHSSVEPLSVPDMATIGERIKFSGHEGKPEDVLNPKKKQLEKIFPDLCTDENGIATYKGIPFMTSAGPCKASLCNAAVR